MSELHRITINPEQCSGKPCIRGMCIRVIDVLELLESGASRKEILDDYPYLEPEDITAAIAYAELHGADYSRAVAKGSRCVR